MSTPNSDTSGCFVGRDTELSRIETSLTAPGSLVILQGEAGVGKTRLMEHVIARQPGAAKATSTLLAVCPPFRERYTLAPLIEAVARTTGPPPSAVLSPLTGVLRPFLPEWNARLPRTPEPAPDSRSERFRLYRALDEILTLMGVRTLALDDAHLADDATVEFLAFRQSATHDGATILTARPPEDGSQSIAGQLMASLPSRTAITTISVDLLDTSTTGALVASLLDIETVPPRVAALIWAKTAGLPLAVVELVAFLRDHAPAMLASPDEWLLRSLDDIPIPATVAATVLRRLAALDADARACVEAVAVLGDRARDDSVADIARLSLDAARDGLSAAVRRDLARDDGHARLRLTHPLIAQAVYDDIPTPRRRELHRRAADVIEASSPTAHDTIATHARRAGDNARWREHARLAADAALNAGDDSAAAHLLFSLATTGHPNAQELVELVSNISYENLGASEDYPVLIERLRGLLDTEGMGGRIRAEVHLQLGRLYGVVDQYALRRAEFEGAMPYLSGDLAAQVRTMGTLGYPFDPVETVAVHRRWLAQAMELSRELPWPDRLHAVVNCNTALRLMGDPAGWDEDLVDMAELANPRERIDVARDRNNRADAGLYWGRYDETERSLLRSAELDLSDFFPHHQPMLARTRMHLDWLRGHWQEIGETSEIPEGPLGPAGAERIETLLVWGSLRAVRGDPSGAHTMLLQALSQAWETGSLQFCSEISGMLAWMSIDAGEPEAALTTAHDTIEMIERKGLWLWATDVAPAYVLALCRLDRRTDAERLIAEWGTAMDGINAPSAAAALRLSEGALALRAGDEAAGSASLEEAARRWDRLPRPYLTARTLEVHGLELARLGSAARAVDALSAAHERHSSLGSSEDARRVARALQRLGVKPPRQPWRGGRHGYGDQLSPSESDVVRLVVAGLSNREIAESLVRSPKTVYSQLRSAMLKLHASSRVELALMATAAHPETPAPATRHES